jgi:hypothetical protein
VAGGEARRGSELMSEAERGWWTIL